MGTNVVSADTKPDVVKSGKENTSKVNFTIGAPTNHKFYDETTAGKAFEGYSQQERIQVDVPNLRGSNFNVGTTKVDYTTTTQAIQNDFNR